MSVDDNVAESQFTFVASALEWWKPVERSAVIGTQSLDSLPELSNDVSGLVENGSLS